jgi:hypothetical protein
MHRVTALQRLAHTCVPSVQVLAPRACCLFLEIAWVDESQGTSMFTGFTSATLALLVDCFV